MLLRDSVKKNIGICENVCKANNIDTIKFYTDLNIIPILARHTALDIWFCYYIILRKHRYENSIDNKRPNNEKLIYKNSILQINKNAFITYYIDDEAIEHLLFNLIKSIINRYIISFSLQ